MPLLPTLRHSLAALTLVVVPAAASESAAGSQVYDLAVSGIPVGSVTIRSEQDGAAYSAASAIMPNAFVSALTSYRFDGRASGTVDGRGNVRPVRFTADSTSPRATRRTEIEWKGETPVRVSVAPPRKHAVDPERVAGALDPVSAGFALLRDNTPERICDTRVEVFDGSRRSRLTLADPVPAADGTLVCAGRYEQLEGERQNFATEAEYPFTLVFAPRGDGMVRLERIETRTRFGPAVVTRRAG